MDQKLIFPAYILIISPKRKENLYLLNLIWNLFYLAKHKPPSIEEVKTLKDRFADLAHMYRGSLSYIYIYIYIYIVYIYILRNIPRGIFFFQDCFGYCSFIRLFFAFFF